MEVKARKEYELVSKTDPDDPEKQGGRKESKESPCPSPNKKLDNRNKIIAFVALVIIQGSHVLFFKTSQRGGEYQYNTASAICITEFVKLVLSMIFHIQTKGDGPLIPHIQFNEFATWSILAICYCVNNQLTFWLLVFLGPGQLSLGKSFAPMLTAVLLWQMYGEYINKVQWSCLILVVAGLVNVLYTITCPDKDKSGNSTDATLDNHNSLIFGSALLYVSCMITAFSSVFNAKMLQKGQIPLHVQNCLLYSQGAMFNLFAYWLNFTPSKVDGFFTGYNNVNVFLVLLSQSLMGIAITFVYKYGGAIVKTLATGAQAALLTVADGLFFGVALGPGRLAGAVTVFMASHLYFTVALKQEKSPVETSNTESLTNALLRKLAGLFFIGSIVIAGFLLYTYSEAATP